MSNYAVQWLPYLGDTVAVRAGDCDLSGVTTRYDPSLVDVEARTEGLQDGSSVGVAWRLGSAVHRCTGRIEGLRIDGFSVRLALAPTPTSRRTHERVSLSVPVVVTSSLHGSYGHTSLRGRTLDLSDGGLRALLDADAAVGIGEAVTVRVELGGRVETLRATVVWENAHCAGERIAGLAFSGSVDTAAWRGLSQRTP